MRLKIWPDSPLANMNIGGLLAKLGKFDEAMNRFQAAEKYNPADAPAALYDGQVAWLRAGRRMRKRWRNSGEALQLE